MCYFKVVKSLLFLFRLFNYFIANRKAQFYKFKICFYTFKTKFDLRVRMFKKILALFFAFSFILFISVAFAADDGFFSSWQTASQSFQTPDLLVNFLTYFGIPKEITVNWGGILYYIIIPMLTFAIVLKTILIDTIVVDTIGIRTFRGWKGWLFVLLIISFLAPTGILGMTAMWLYATAGILVVYGFGALLIMGVVSRLIYRRTGAPFYGLVAGVIISALLALFIPGVGIVLAILGILMAIVGYSRTKKIGFAELPEEKQNELDFSDQIESIIRKHLVDKEIPSRYHDAYIKDAREIKGELNSGMITLEQAKQRTSSLKTRIDQHAEGLKRQALPFKG